MASPQSSHISGGGERRGGAVRVPAPSSRRGPGAALSAWGQDVRFALRQARRAPVFTAIAVLTLALGIGANAAIFSVVHRLLLDPLPYPDGNRIVMLATAQDDGETFPSVAALRAIAEQARTVETVAAVSVVGIAVQEEAAHDTVYALVTPNYLRLLGVAPALGRAFTPAEGRGEGPPVAMISHARWQREFGGRPNALGALVEVNVDGPNGTERRQYTVVGVTPLAMGLPMSPPAFNGNLREPTPGVWLPLDLSRWSPDEHPHAYARLRPGADVGTATRELQRILDTSPGVGGPRSPRSETVRVQRARDRLAAGPRRMVEVLFAAVGVLLLIACANVANLLMARAWSRRREIAVRAALGARPVRLVRQVLTESAVLALSGGLLGVLVAGQTLRVILALRPPTLTTLDTVRLDATVLLWSVGISMLSALLFGVLPALLSARGSVADVLRSESSGSAGSTTTRRVRSALVVGEIALSLVLLVAAGLLVRSLDAMHRVPLGFEPRGLVSFDLLFNTRTPRDPGVRAALRDEIVQRLRAVPGVTDAAIGMLPAAGFGGSRPLRTAPDPSGAVRSVPEFSSIFVGADYFRVVGVRLLEGRVPDARAALLPGGADGAPREVVVNRGLATRVWPHGGAIGALLYEQDAGRPGQAYVVVGIAQDVRMPGPSRPARAAVLYQAPRLASFVVRTAARAEDLLPALRRAIGTVEPTPFVQTTTVGEVFLRESLAPTRFALALLGAFASVALVLALVGLYGVIAYSVAQRTREIGVRVALGAKPAAVVRLVLGTAARLAGAGVVIGVAGALAATRALSALLFGVSAGDPLTFAGAAFIVAGVGVLASYVPARRAVRLHPADVLRAP